MLAAVEVSGELELLIETSAELVPCQQGGAMARPRIAAQVGCVTYPSLAGRWCCFALHSVDAPPVLVTQALHAAQQITRPFGQPTRGDPLAAGASEGVTCNDDLNGRAIRPSRALGGVVVVRLQVAGQVPRLFHDVVVVVLIEVVV
jgi:hypothetical protein